MKKQNLVIEEKDMTTALWYLYGVQDPGEKSACESVKIESHPVTVQPELSCSPAEKCGVGLCKNHGEQVIPGSSVCWKCVKEGIKPSSHPGRKLRVGVQCPKEGECVNSPYCRLVYSQDFLGANGCCDWFSRKI